MVDMEISPIAHVIQLSVAPGDFRGHGQSAHRLAPRAREAGQTVKESKHPGPLPAAVLLDLDDTILDDSSLIDDCWREACSSHATRLRPHETSTVVQVIRNVSAWYWSDPERHRAGRLDLDATRCEVVRLALIEIGIEDAALAEGIGQAYARSRDAGMVPLPDAIDTVRWLRASGPRLALITNGAGPAQRSKIARFGLADLFDAVLVEGEVGFGKPDERVYRLALDKVGVRAADAWMVGDNLEWDVAAPQRLGMFGVWIDRTGRGLPPKTDIRPDLIIRALSDLRALPS